MKLIYVLDSHNAESGSEYEYLTDLAVKCSARRMYPKKKIGAIYGDIYRKHSELIEYKVYMKFLINRNNYRK